MTEIKVIEKAVAVDIDTLPAEERDAIFEKLSELKTSIPRVHFEAFNEQRNIIIAKEQLMITPTIIELLMRKIINMSSLLYQLSLARKVPIELISTQGYIVTFIVEEVLVRDLFIKNIRKYQSSATRSSRSSTGNSLYSDESRKKNSSNSIDNVDKRKPNQDDFLNKKVPRGLPPANVKMGGLVGEALTTQFDYPTRCVTNAGIIVIVPPNTEVKIIGVKISSICYGTDTNKNTKEYIAQMLISGILPAYTLAADCNSKFRVFTPNQIHGIFMNPTIEQLKKIHAELLGMITQVYRLGEKMSSFALNDFARNYKLPKELSLPAFRSPYTLDSEAKSLSAMLKLNIDSNFHTNMLFALDNIHALQIYTMARMHGIDDKSVMALITQLQRKFQKRDQEAAIKRKMLNEIYLTNTLLKIIEDKLGSKRAAIIEQKIQTIVPKPEGIQILNTGLLNASESKLVENSYRTQIKQLEQVITNKCPHVATYRKFRKAKNDMVRNAEFEELMKFSLPTKSKHSSHEHIVCKLCKGDLICPHVRLFTEMTMKRMPYDKIRIALGSYINKSVSSNYYCIVCGEVISGLNIYEDAEQNEDMYHTISDELKPIMYGEIIGILRNTSQNSLVNINKLVGLIMNGIYEYIFEIEKQLLKNRTNSAIDILNKKKLFINIYGYAYIIHMIINNRAKGINILDFNNMNKFVSSRTVADYIKFAIMNIVQTRNSIIYQIANISTDFIKSKIIDAYKLISQKGKTISYVGEEEEDLFVVLMLDPMYHYLYYLRTIDDAIAGVVKKVPGDKLEHTRSIKRIMGEDLTKLPSLKDGVFSSSQPPKLSDWPLDEFDNLNDIYVDGKLNILTTVTRGKSQAKSSSSSLVYKEAFLGYVGRAYSVWWPYYKNRIFELPVYINAPTPPSSPLEVNSIMNPLVVKYKESLSDFYKQEKIIRRHVQMSNAKLIQLPPISSSRSFKYINVPIGRIYGEDGHEHEWNDNIYRNPKSKCKICSIEWDKVDTIDESKILASIQLNADMKNFYTYYANRCTEGFLHEYNKDSKCVRCGFSKNMSKEDQNTFYSKYMDKFEQDKLADINEYAKEQIPSVQKAQSVQKTDDTPTMHIFDFNVPLTLSTQLKINNNIFMALGSIEGVIYEEVKNGKYIPSEPDFKDDSRIFVLDSILLTLIADYNKLRNYASIIKPTDELKYIVENSEVKRFEYAKLNEILPELYGEFYEKFTKMRKTMKPREIVEYLLQHIAEFCLAVLRIEDVGEIKTSKLRQAFVSTSIAKIIRTDEMKSKAGLVNWAMFRKDIVSESEDRAAEVATENEIQLTEEEIKDQQGEVVDNEEEEYAADTNNPFENHFDVDDADEDIHDPDAENDFDIITEDYI